MELVRRMMWSKLLSLGVRRGPASPAPSGRLGKAKVGILTILDEEREAVCLAVGASERDGKYFRRPADPRHDSVCVVRQSPDRTNVPAATATKTLIEDWQPDIVLLVGIAGGIAGRGPWLGDVVVPNYLHYADFRKLLENSDDARHCAYDQPAVTLREEISDPVRIDDNWITGLPTRPQEENAPRDLPVVFADGSLVAGEKVMGDPKHYEQRRVVANYSDAHAIDMESFGFGRGVHESRSEPDYNPRLLVIRGISDLVRASTSATESSPDQAAEVNNAQRKRWKRYAAATAAAFAAAVVEEYSQ